MKLSHFFMEGGASLVRQTYHFNFKGSSLVRAKFKRKSHLLDGHSGEGKGVILCA